MFNLNIIYLNFLIINRTTSGCGLIWTPSMNPRVFDNMERWMLIALYDFPEASKSMRNCKTLAKSADKGSVSLRTHQCVQFCPTESYVVRAPGRFLATRRLTTFDEKPLEKSLDANSGCCSFSADVIRSGFSWSRITTSNANLSSTGNQAWAVYTGQTKTTFQVPFIFFQTLEN